MNIPSAELAALTAELVSIDSVNPDVVPGGAGEARVAAFVAAWMERAGLAVSVVEPVAGRPSVVGVARGRGDGRSLMLNAHTDTVGVVGMIDPHLPRVDGDRLYGRGAFDMKASLALCMLAGAQAAASGLAGDVVVAAVSDEESTSLGTASLLPTWRTDAAIVTEPSEEAVCVAHRGLIWLDLHVEGIAAHGSQPQLGRDAILDAARVVAGLGELQRSLEAEAPHPRLGTGLIHASNIVGGEGRSTYPPSCRVELERRTIPGETAADALAEIEHLIASAADRAPGLRARVELVLERPPFGVDEHADVVKVLLEAIRASGKDPHLIGHGAWMDAALLAAAGVPTVVYGPAGGGAHATEEWVDLASLDRCAAVLLRAVGAFCA